MSNVQLNSELLKEVSQLMLQLRPFDASHHIGALLVSGQRPAEVVRMILSQHLRTNPTYTKFHIELVDSDKSFFSTSPVYIKKLALRWTRFLEISDFFYKPTPNVETYFPLFLQHNSVEKLQLSVRIATNINSYVISTVKACSNLSILSCPLNSLLLLFREARGSFSKVHTIETSDYATGVEPFFTYLTEHPDQFPALHTLTISALYDLNLLAESFYDYSFPNVKSINIESDTKCRTATFFSKFESICTSFPNLENASLTLTASSCELDSVYKAFATFNPKAVFVLNYKLLTYKRYNDEELGILKSRLASKGTISSTSQVDDYKTYVVNTSYPNKSMTLEMHVRTGEQLDIFGILSELQGAEATDSVHVQADSSTSCAELLWQMLRRIWLFWLTLIFGCSEGVDEKDDSDDKQVNDSDSKYNQCSDNEQDYSDDEQVYDSDSEYLQCSDSEEEDKWWYDQYNERIRQRKRKQQSP